MNNNDKDKVVYITREGLAKVKDELDWRESVRRPEIANFIAAAKAEGDVSENAGYDEAKYQAGMNEGRILELREKIKYAVFIDKEDGPADVVGLGRTVRIRDLEFGDEEAYTIVGSAEADPSHGRISNSSPTGVALMGQRAGAVVRVNTPGGEMKYEIVAIE
ncbi:MAG: transcription elongation factor GreA [Caldilineales bacterium]|nr:transcription elongation factor GreA [Caldilineales bacterium]MCW5857198.1 transcription elongation factor GreA [Caldilineales bacterium]